MNRLIHIANLKKIAGQMKLTKLGNLKLITYQKEMKLYSIFMIRQIKKFKHSRF